MTAREARAWRRLALAGAGTVALLCCTVLGYRREKVRSADVSGETRDEEIERRLHACEMHLQNLPPERTPDA